MSRHRRSMGEWNELASQPDPAEPQISLLQVVIGLLVAAALIAPGIAWSVQHHAHWI
jgi:hypothetical protein